MRQPSGELKLGDLIISANGQAVRTVEDLLATVEDVPLNSKVELTILRGGDEAAREKVSVLAVDRAEIEQLSRPQ